MKRSRVGKGMNMRRGKEKRKRRVRKERRGWKLMLMVRVTRILSASNSPLHSSSRLRCNNRALSYFSKLVDTLLLQDVVEQINLYAEQCIADHTIKQHSRVRKWETTHHQ